MNIEVICIGVAVIIILFSYIVQLNSDIVRINKKLDIIGKQIGLDDIISENIDEELKNLIVEGKKNQAIKKYRVLTGEGLKEAKDYVDVLSEKNS